MNIKPKKSLGQNFLRDEKVLERIIESANLSSTDLVIEVGPGKGVLTEKLAKKVSKVLAIEIDQNLIPSLQKKFTGNKKVEIINEDILKINLEEITKSKFQTLPTGRQVPNKIQNSIPSTRDKIQNFSYKVIANIPYYITAKIIRLFLESKNPPTEMLLMVQKEVAERIVANPGKMSLLAVSVQYYATPEILFFVSKNSFFPVPEVDSAVIQITCNMQHATKDFDKKFFQIVKAGFSAKRKTLQNNLANTFHLPKDEVEFKLKTAGLKPTVRAQELSIADWKKIVPLFN